METDNGRPIAVSKAKEGEGLKDTKDDLGRRQWDDDYYLEKAKNNVLFGPERTGKRKDPHIPLPASQRTYLQKRGVELNLEKGLNVRSVVTAHTIKPLQGGYWCSVCECLLKDSSTYLDHVNGRRHNRNLGMTMKVEKIGLDRIKDKLQSLKKTSDAVEPEDIAKRIAAIEEAEEEKKRRKKEKKKRKKGNQGGGGEEEEDDDDEPACKAAKASGSAVEEAEEDEEEETEEMKMMKMMGLPTGF